MRSKIAMFSSNVPAIVAAIGIAFAALPIGGCSDDESAKPSEPKACSHDKIACYGECVDLKSDPDNCGVCGQTCNSAEVCSLGDCKTSCDSSLSKCGRACVNLNSNHDNCHECGNQCEDEQQCKFGQCVSECTEGPEFERCDGTCVDVQTDVKNCGQCGLDCGKYLWADNPICVSGQCWDTPLGFDDCGAKNVVLMTVCGTHHGHYYDLPIMSAHCDIDDTFPCTDERHPVWMLGCNKCVGNQHFGRSWNSDTGYEFGCLEESEWEAEYNSCDL